MTPEKIRVAVLYGGKSGEHEVSLVSASNVIQNLDRTRFEVIPIGIDKQGSWFLGDDVFKQELSHTPKLKLQRDLDRLLFNPELIGQSLQPSHALARNARLFDVVFPVIHGPLCEDGSVQGLLELAEVPYVGCGVLASSVGMDKDVSKRLVQHAGVRTPAYVVIKRDQWDLASSKYCDLIAHQLSYPVFVKPANTGSSVGVYKVDRHEALQSAIQNAFRYDTKVLVEQGINGLEIEVAVLQGLESGEEPVVSVPGEVRPSNQHGFYSYASKYVDEKGAELIIPAVLSEEIKEKVRETAKVIFTALECEGMARVDLFLERNTHDIYFNEVNTIPGFTTISMYPKLMAASGIPYSDLLTHLVMLAIKRHANKTKLSREYIAE